MCVQLRNVKDLPRDQWRAASVRDIMQPCSNTNTVEREIDAASALAGMFRSGASRLLVADGDRLVGIVSQADILRYPAVKFDVEGENKRMAGGILKSTREHLAHET